MQGNKPGGSQVEHKEMHAVNEQDQTLDRLFDTLDKTWLRTEEKG